MASGLCQCGCGMRTSIATVTRADRGHIAGQPLPFFQKHNGRRVSLPDGQYRCSRCKEVFNREEMAAVKAKSGWCRSCSRAHQIEWRLKNPQAFKTLMASSRLRRLYGITVADYLSMYEAQGGRCKICGVEKQSCLEVGSTNPSVLHVDHCHETGLVRGLLCSRCNRVIGLLKEDCDLLAAAIEYLEGVQNG